MLKRNSFSHNIHNGQTINPRSSRNNNNNNNNKFIIKRHHGTTTPNNTRSITPTVHSTPITTTHSHIQPKNVHKRRIKPLNTTTHNKQHIHTQPLKKLSKFPSPINTITRRKIVIGSLQSHTQPLSTSSSSRITSFPAMMNKNNPISSSSASSSPTLYDPRSRASKIHLVSTIEHVYPKYYTTLKPALFPTTPFIINDAETTHKYLYNTLPLPPRRFGTISSDGKEINDADLFDKAINCIEDFGGSIHQDLELGNLYTPEQLSSIVDNARHIEIEPARPSWFGHRITDDWGFIATNDIDEGTILMRIPSSLFIRSQGLIQPSPTSKINEKEIIYQQRIDIISLLQSCLHLIGDSAPLFTEASLQARAQLFPSLSLDQQNNDKNNSNDNNDSTKSKQTKQQKMPQTLILQDKYYKEVIATSLYLLLLKSLDNDYLLKPALDILPESYNVIDLFNDPRSQYTNANTNITPWTMHSFFEDFWIPSLSTITLDQIPPQFFDILGTALSTASQHSPSTTLLDLLFAHFKEPLKISHPQQLFSHLTTLMNYTHQRLLHVLPKDPQDTSTLNNRFLYSPPNNGFIPMLELFRESEQPNCMVTGANYIPKGDNEESDSDDFYGMAGLNTEDDEESLNNVSNSNNNIDANAPNVGDEPPMANQKVTKKPKEKQPPKQLRFKRVPYFFDANAPELDLYDELKAIGINPTQPGARKPTLVEVNDEQSGKTTRNHRNQGSGFTPDNHPKLYRPNHVFGVSKDKRDSNNKTKMMKAIEKDSTNHNNNDAATNNKNNPNPHYTYDSFYYEVIATRDILRGEEVSISTFASKTLHLPIISPQTETKLQRLLQRTDRLKDLIRYSLCRVPQIQHEYNNQRYLYSSTPTELTTSHGIVPNISLRSTTLLLNPRHSTITREITPSYYYLSRDYMNFSRYPTEQKYSAKQKLFDFNGDLNQVKNIDLELTSRDRRLVKLREDSLPYLSFFDAPLKYIVPSYYDDFDLGEIFTHDKRWNIINEAFLSPPSLINTTNNNNNDNKNNSNRNNKGRNYLDKNNPVLNININKTMIDKHQQFEMSWLGPSHPNLEAFYRFYFAPGFLAPHPDKAIPIILKSPSLSHGPGQQKYDKSGNFVNTITPKQSFDFVIEQFKNRFNYVCDIAEANLRTRYKMPTTMPLSSAQWIEAFSTKLDDENEMCKFIGLYQSSARLCEKLQHTQNFRQLINAYEEVLLGEGASGMNLKHRFGDSYNNANPFDHAMAIKVKYNQTALVSHLAKVFAGRLGLDKQHLLSHDQISRILDNSSLGYDEMYKHEFSPVRLSPQQVNQSALSNNNKNDTNTQQKQKQHQQALLQFQKQQYDEDILPQLDAFREAYNGGLSIPPRWHALDGLPYDRFNQYHQALLFSDDYMNSNTSQQSPGGHYSNTKMPFRPSSETDYHNDSSRLSYQLTNAIPRYKPYIPKSSVGYK